eukprot:3943432-Pleurochrysis_carterae.AAC.4
MGKHKNAETKGPYKAEQESWTVHDGAFFAEHVLSGHAHAPMERRLLTQLEPEPSKVEAALIEPDVRHAWTRI